VLGLRPFFKGLTVMPVLAKMMSSGSNRPVRGFTPPYPQEFKESGQHKTAPKVLQDKEHE
jgi:hypothetical protein